MPFHRDDLTLLLHVLEGQPNVPSNFEFISYRNNPRQKLSIYFNKTKPLILDAMWLIWYFQQRLLSIRTPRYLTYELRSILINLFIFLIRRSYIIFSKILLKTERREIGR